MLTDRRATVPPIVKTVYLLRTKSCARFGLNFSIFLPCQVKIPDEKHTRHLYLLGKNINKPQVHFYEPLSAKNSPENVVDKFSSSNFSNLSNIPQQHPFFYMHYELDIIVLMIQQGITVGRGCFCSEFVCWF